MAHRSNLYIGTAFILAISVMPTYVQAGFEFVAPINQEPSMSAPKVVEEKVVSETVLSENLVENKTRDIKTEPESKPELKPEVQSSPMNVEETETKTWMGNIQTTLKEILPKQKKSVSSLPVKNKKILIASETKSSDMSTKQEMKGKLPDMVMKSDDNSFKNSEFSQPVELAVSDKQVAQGFATQVPLVIALQQIVPADYRYVFADSVNPGMKVDWRGGKPWDEVVSDMTRAHGVSAEISGNVIYLRSTPPVEMAMAQKTKIVQKQEMHENDKMAPVELTPVVQMPKKPLSQSPINDLLVDEKPMRDVLPKTMSLQKSAQPIQLDQKISNEPQSLLVRSDRLELSELSIGQPMELTPPSSVHQVKPFVPTTYLNNGSQKTTAMQGVVSNQSQQEGEFVESTFGNNMMSQNSMISGGYQWQADSGATLRSILVDWAEQANVSLVWKSKFNYPIQVDVNISGSFEKAVQTVLDGLSSAEPRPLGRLHLNQPSGQPVLVIETENLDG